MALPTDNPGKCPIQKQNPFQVPKLGGQIIYPLEQETCPTNVTAQPQGCSTHDLPLRTLCCLRIDKLEVFVNGRDVVEWAFGHIEPEELVHLGALVPDYALVETRRNLTHTQKSEEEKHFTFESYKKQRYGIRCMFQNRLRNSSVCPHLSRCTSIGLDLDPAPAGGKIGSRLKVT